MRFKGSPWWLQMTPLTEDQENSIRLPLLNSMRKLEEGKAALYDFGVLAGNIRVCRHLTKHFENESDLDGILKRGYEALERTHGLFKEKKAFCDDDITDVVQAALLCDDLLTKCERFRVCEAIEKARVKK